MKTWATATFSFTALSTRERVRRPSGIRRSVAWCITQFVESFESGGASLGRGEAEAFNALEEREARVLLPPPQLRVNPATVRQWVTKGQLKASRAGVRKWIVRRSELEWMLAATSSAGRGRRADRGAPRAGVLRARSAVS
jgi:hypothetical protein